MRLSCDRQGASCCARTHCSAGAHTCRSSCVGSQLDQWMVCPSASRYPNTYVFRKPCMRGHVRVGPATSRSWLPLDLAVRAQAMPWSRQRPTARAWRNRQRNGGVCSTEMSSMADVGRSLQCVTPGRRLWQICDASQETRPLESRASDDDMAQEPIAPDDGGGGGGTLVEGSRCILDLDTP